MKFTNAFIAAVAPATALAACNSTYSVETTTTLDAFESIELIGNDMANVAVEVVATNAEDADAFLTYRYTDIEVVTPPSVVIEGTTAQIDTTALTIQELPEECSGSVHITVHMPTDTCWYREGNKITKVAGENCVRVLHINDFHAYIEGIAGGACVKDDGSLCDGGWPKIFTMVKKLAAAAPQRTIFIDAGDQFNGTPWSYVYRGTEALKFIKPLCDNTDLAACFGAIGNHEFDYGYDVVAEYARNATQEGVMTMINSNIVDDCENKAVKLGDYLQKSHEILVGDKVIRLDGFLTPSTPSISANWQECLTLNDEVKSVDVTATEDVDFTIHISHSGIYEDVKISRALDAHNGVIVGSHTHTTLWNGEQNGAFRSGPANKYFGPKSTILEEDASYPFQPTDAKIPIVQASRYSIFLGGFDLVFLENEVKITPIQEYLRSSANETAGEAFWDYIPSDEQAVDIITDLRDAVDELTADVVGKTSVDLEQENIRSGSRHLGNIICDAMMEASTKPQDGALTADFCIQNSGGIRAPILAGDITFGQVITVLPFGNTVSVVEITGKNLYFAAEYGLAVGSSGRFPQIGGFMIDYNSTVAASCGFTKGVDDCTGDNTPTRVYGLYRLNADGSKGELIPNDDTKYKLASNDFTAAGGDGYDVLKKRTEPLLTSGPALDLAFVDYIDGKDFNEDDFVSRIIDVSVPTASPTASPTTSPTASPTTSPTASPTTPETTSAPTTPETTSAPTTPETTSAPTTSAPTASPTAAADEEASTPVVGIVFGVLGSCVVLGAAVAVYMKANKSKEADATLSNFAAENPSDMHSANPKFVEEV